VDSKENKWVSS